jgi:macrolide transport system ATP-binding/permease protein
VKRLRALFLRLGDVFLGARRERDLDNELASHLQMHIDDNLRSGMSPEQARRHALLKLGGVEPAKEAYRDRRSVPFLENLLSDVRFAVRQLRKNPGFTVTAILMLTLGMCASVAIFAFVDAALIKPLPYRNPARLVLATESTASFPHANLSYPDYLDWKKFNTVFSSLDTYQHRPFSLSAPSGAQKVNGARVSDGFFRTLGVMPVLGRDFHPGEDLLSAPRTVLLSYAAWQQRYGGSPDVLGKTVTLNGDPNVIIGVLPREFHFTPAEPADFWATLHASGECDLRRSCHSLDGVGRLKDGTSIQAALANVQSIARQLEKLYPESNRDQGANVMPLSEVIVGDIRPILLVLLAGAVLLLLIASVNVASLLLVRSESRRREIAVRNALGASAARLIGQFVAEGLVLVAAGSALGLMSAYGAIQLLVKLIPADALAAMSYLRGLGLNSRVAMFAAAIALLAAILFSVTPVVHLSLVNAGNAFAARSTGNAGNAFAARSTGNTWRRLGSKLVVVELATAMVLLAGAGLLGKSLYRLLRVEIGFDANRLVMLQVSAPKSSYANDAQTIALARHVVNQLASLPGVSSVALTTDIPITHWGDTTWFRVLGRPWHGEHNDTPERDVSSTYFTTIGAKLLRGRYFTESEDAAKPRVAIINRTLAKQFFPGEDPIGKQISGLSTPPKPIEIVGIVDDIKEGGLDTANRPVLYFPFNQNAGNYFILAVRTAQAGPSILPALSAAIHQINPGIVTAGGAAMTDRINDSQSAYLHRSSAWLVGSFAALALLLGAVGLYGVVAYSVSQRTREIGVRMALGAERSPVYRLILKEAGGLIAVGIVIGLIASFGAATLMHGLLFSVRSWDVPTFAAVAIVLGVSALLAGFFPARRAAAVNPIEALRAE